MMEQEAPGICLPIYTAIALAESDTTFGTLEKGWVETYG